MASVIPRLSICIPTWNRDVYLESLLARLDEEVAPHAAEVQILVSDNGSSDRTREVVMPYLSRPGFVYMRQDTNVGPQRNFLDAVAAASGEYCWLFGDDDFPINGSLAAVLRLLSEHSPDVLLPSRDGLQFVAETTKFPDLHEYVEYFAKIRPRTLLDVTFITATIFRRSLWMSVPDKERFFPTWYVHSFTVAEGLRRGGTVVVASDRVYAIPKYRAPYDPRIDPDMEYVQLQYLMSLAYLAESEALQRHVRRDRFRVLKTTAGNLYRLTRRYLRDLGRFLRSARRSLFARGDAFFQGSGT